jgi:hypothetical protein
MNRQQTNEWKGIEKLSKARLSISSNKIILFGLDNMHQLTKGKSNKFRLLTKLYMLHLG